ncbi:MAG: sigma-70 family RNA polymerase sigma factor [Phycisphaerae bacterium]
MDAKAISQLLARCRAGDKTAWDALVEAYWQRLYGYAMKATGKSELAQDLVQETFLRIVQRLDRYDDQGKFEAWLFRILVNLVRDYGRGLTRRPTQSMTVELDGQIGDLTDVMSDPEDVSPEDNAVQSEDVDRLVRAMRKLPELDAHILMLRHYADMPFKDIAATLNCPIGTVLARAHRALGKLRGLMESDGHEV